MVRRFLFLVALAPALTSGVIATVFGSVRGVVHDPQMQPKGNLEALFVEDQFKATSWLTLTGGLLRYTHFDGQIAENGMDPWIGAAVQILKLKWIVRAAYSYYYQAPPLDTVSGSLIGNTGCDGCGFLPLYGERDIQQEHGVTIPIRGWAVSETYFHTSARNFFDHDSLGNSKHFLPLTTRGAVISGLETTVRSPLLLKRYRAHVVYSNQNAQGVGAITGGLTDFTTPPSGTFVWTAISGIRFRQEWKATCRGAALRR